MLPTTPPGPAGWITLTPSRTMESRRRSLEDLAGWEIRVHEGRWRIRTRESYLNQKPTLLITRWIGSVDFDHLAALPAQPATVSVQPGEIIEDTLLRLRAYDDLPSLAAEFQLLFMRTPTQLLPEVMRHFFQTRAAETAPDGELLTVDVDAQLTGRYTAAKGLFTANIAPKQITQGIDLPAGQGLATSYAFGADVSIAPALLALAPYVYGVPSGRAHAAGLWLFGKTVAGLHWPSNHVIEAVRPSDDRFVGPRQRGGRARPAATPAQLKHFLTWWVGQLNQFLAIASDPCNFPDTKGDYQPMRHWQFLASIERLFRDVAEVLTHTEHRETARLRAAYDALDTLQGMGRGDFDALVRPSKATKTLARLRQDLPPDIAAVALPTCARAVHALEAVKEGFIPTSRYYTPDGLADLPGKPGLKKWDEATALYLRRDRNSAHSFLNLQPWEQALLFSHDGRLPRDVASLPFLYLLDLLARPEHLAAQLRR